MSEIGKSFASKSKYCSHLDIIIEELKSNVRFKKWYEAFFHAYIFFIFSRAPAVFGQGQSVDHVEAQQVSGGPQVEPQQHNNRHNTNNAKWTHTHIGNTGGHQGAGTPATPGANNNQGWAEAPTTPGGATHW